MSSSRGLCRREVFVLGAGFSRAVSSEMPVTVALGEQAASRAGCRVQKLPCGT